MVTTPVLALLDFTDTFIVETDAFNYGIGAVLSQKGWPIAYLSKALGPSKRAWSIYSKEMLAIMEAVKLWWPYLMTHHWSQLDYTYNQLKSIVHNHM